ncbi:MAG: hypothetical protein WA957_13265 [Alteraurantiacibacter sp.]
MRVSCGGRGLPYPVTSGRDPIAQTYAFYNARADEAAAEASKAKLDNVRDRALRSEKTWRGLAHQAQKVESDRAKAVQVRKERQEAEAEAELEQMTVQPTHSIQ